jgi:hypothetical protein
MQPAEKSGGIPNQIHAQMGSTRAEMQIRASDPSKNTRVRLTLS